MNRLEQLPEIANRQLSGLTADQRLLANIKIKAAQPRHKQRLRLRPLLTGAVTIALCLCIGLFAVPTLLHTQNDALRLDSHSAGSMITTTNGAILQTLDVPAGSISVGGSSASSGTYRNLFATQKNGNYPMIMVGNAVYRLLISPLSMSDSLLGSSLGEVTEYTVEPALSNGGIVSNFVSAGATVYAVKGMQGAMAAAYVNGSLRAFQRVSYAGDALLGSEALGDTLTASHNVTAIELTGAGTINDAGVAQSLINTLLANAQYQSASFDSGANRSLLIALDNGLLLQMMVGEDTVSACGTWSCPEFFEAYAAAAAK